MRVANQPTNGQLRVVKKKTTIKDEVRHIQEMRKQLVHQLPQIFAAADPQPVVNPEEAVKVKSIGLVKEEQDDVPKDVDDLGGEAADGAAVLAINKINKAIGVLTITICVLCFANALAEVIIPLDRSYLAGSAQAAKFYASSVARFYVESGLAIAMLVESEPHRTLGTLMLCAVVAEIVMLCVAKNSGFEIGLLISVPIAGIKIGLGWLGLVDD